MEMLQPIAGRGESNTLEVLSERTVFNSNTQGFLNVTEEPAQPKNVPPEYQGELTVVMPGQGRAHWVDESKTEYHQPTSSQPPSSQPPKDRSADGNLLLISAMPVINFVMNLASSDRLSDFDTVRSRLISDIDRFVNKSMQGVSDQRKIMAARYVLCSFTDEMLATSEWGLAHRWGAESLLSYFHNETEGGRRFFTLLDQAIQQPHFQLDLLELMYVCLSLGFSGYYRVDSEGRVKLETKRESLMTTISAYRKPDNSGLVMGEVSSERSSARSKRWIAYVIIGLLTISGLASYLSASNSVDLQRMQILGAFDLEA